MSKPQEKLSPLEQLASNIKAGCALASDFNPAEDIQAYIDNQKTDILIVDNGGGVIEVHANRLDSLGSVVYAKCDEEQETIEVDTIDPVALPGGNADEWFDELSTYDGSEKSVTEFMMDFVAKFNQ